MNNKKDKKIIFANNLSRILSEKGISQYKMIKDLELKKTTVNYWCKGKAFPRYEALLLVADYLGVSISELTDEQPDVDDNKEHFYPDPETRKTLEELRTNDELKMLFDAARTASPEDLKAAHALILALKSKEKPEQ